MPSPLINLICLAALALIHLRFSFYGNSISATITRHHASASILKRSSKAEGETTDDENQVSFDEQKSGAQREREGKSKTKL
jgi:hypothetical protein